ncbi:cystatin-like protein, partial [Clarias magur]
TMKSSLNVNVLLMVTTCKKASKDVYEHRDECNKQKNGTPWIECLVCTTKDDKEHIDCGTQRDVKN